MWSFAEDSEAYGWIVTNGDKYFTLNSRDEAIELSALLNGYELGVGKNRSH